MLLPGTLLASRYRADSVLGRGGMGEVWRCFDTQLNRNVVVKTVSPQLVKARPQHTSIFIDEARIGASLVGHPNVVAVHDLVNDVAGAAPTLAIVMELVEGMSCADWIERSAISLDPETRHAMSLMIAMETCKAIAYAHRQKILHRDIKPLNIFISKYGITKIGDFGIARYADAVTREHTVWNFRSPAYSAPEQWRDEKPDFPTDLYQLGCTLYSLFTGKMPFEAASMAALIQKHLTEAPRAPKVQNTLLSDQLSELIVKCLSKTASDRPQIWQLGDAIARELQKSYSIKIEFDKTNRSLIDAISAVTEFNEEAMEKSGEFTWPYVDYNEAISEAFELFMLGGVTIKLTTGAAPSATPAPQPPASLPAAAQP